MHTHTHTLSKFYEYNTWLHYVLLLLYTFHVFLWQCKSDSFGEDNSETEGSSEYNTEDEYMDGFIDDSDIDSYPPSPLPNSGGNLFVLLDLL